MLPIFQDVAITLVLGVFFLVAGVISSLYAPDWNGVDEPIYCTLIAEAVSLAFV